MQLDEPESVHHVEGESQVAGCYRMIERGVGHVLVQVPLGRAPVKVRDLGLMPPGELVAEHIGEEPVIAEPLAVVVERNREQVLTLQPFQS